MKRKEVSFIVDANGSKQFAVVPIELYYSLLENNINFMVDSRSGSTEPAEYQEKTVHRSKNPGADVISPDTRSGGENSANAPEKEIPQDIINIDKDEQLNLGREQTFYFTHQLAKKYAAELKQMNTELFFFTAKNVLAWGYPIFSDKRVSFMVMAKSEISENTADSFRIKAKEERDFLLLKKIIKQKKNSGIYCFTQNYLFNSASLAASVVAGNNRSGAEAWKTADGLLLRDFIARNTGGDGAPEL